MYPFEVWDERTQRTEFYWNRWAEYRAELFNQYPITDKWRIEITISHSNLFLYNVPTYWNPHEGVSDGEPHDCFYNNSNWSTIFDVFPQHDHSNPGTFRLFAEHGHDDPWGEQLDLHSTSSDWMDNHSTRFVRLRGYYWLVTGWRICGWAPDYYRWFTDRSPVIRRMPDIREIMGVQPMMNRGTDDVTDAWWRNAQRRLHPFWRTWGNHTQERVNWIREGF